MENYAINSHIVGTNAVSSPPKNTIFTILQKILSFGSLSLLKISLNLKHSKLLKKEALKPGASIKITFECRTKLYLCLKYFFG